MVTNELDILWPDTTPLRSKPMTTNDDELTAFAARGSAPLPADGLAGFVENRDARIWYCAFGSGPPLVLLHGGAGSSKNFGFQVPAFVAAGYRVVTIDSRGHGRSNMPDQPMSYALMASDVRAVMDALGVGKAAIVGWSDGAATGLVMAKETPERVDRLFFFACNVDPTGTKPFIYTETIGRFLERLKKDYAEMSPTPDGFDALFEALQPMQREQPNYGPDDLAAVAVPVTVAQAEHDEFIKPEHAAHVAAFIPGSHLVLLTGVSHFAPVQRPETFNAAVADFLTAKA